MSIARFIPRLLPLLAAALWGCDSPAPAPQAAPPSAVPAPAPAPAAPAGSQRTIDLRDLGYDVGSAEAPVVVVEFSDFGCPYCARFALESFPVIEEEFIRTERVRWKYIPFALGIFPHGAEAALAGQCGGAQDRFWEMHDQLYLAQKEWKGAGDPATVFREIAGRAGLDAGRFAACYDGRERGAEVERGNTVARQLGVRATPSFLVNGQPVQGALPLEQFRDLLEWAETRGP